MQKHTSSQPQSCAVPADGPVVWEQVNTPYPASAPRSLRGTTIVIGPTAAAPVFPVLPTVQPRYFGEDLVLEGEEPAQREAYIKALKRHDWSFEFSSGRTYEQGRDSLRALKRMQPVVDPDGALWNAAAPAEFRLVLA